MKYILVILLTVFLLSSCAGTTTGVMEDPITQSSIPVSVSWDGGGLGAGNVTVTVEDEVFSGKWVQQQTFGNTFGFATSGGQNAFFSGFGSSQSTTHNAVLIGDKGHTMTCNIISDGFTGIGRCSVSNGKNVSFTF